MYKKLDLTRFSPVASPDIAYVLGFIATDGNIQDRRYKTTGWRGGEYLRFDIQKRDLLLLEKIRDVLKVDNPIYHRARKLGDTITLQLSCPGLVSCFSYYNITPKKSFTLEYPTKLNRNLQRHFIRGVWDGDGYYGLSTRHGKVNNQNVTVSSASLIFLVKLSNALGNKNIQSRIEDEKRLPPRHTLYRLMVRPNSFNILYDYLYKDANIYLPRKKAKFEEILKYRDKSFESSSSKTVEALFE